ncbi:zinc-binding dehydrogenase [Microbacterium sp. zg.B185]|uniref:zinc-binding dehydrogenase n=1 Tax=Microbacterium sp. zg.B185 TaxID=2969410 RepID=UPI002805A72D|nr:zinc-binding dehydrogenase [Microbacterium sp. zg.B185]
MCVIGDGAVGLMAVMSARQLGAERIILMTGRQGRAALGRSFGASDIVASRGDEAVSTVAELTGGVGTNVVIEAVGSTAAFEQALGLVRDGGTISQIGVPSSPGHLESFTNAFTRNLTLTGGLAPTRAYTERLMAHILDGGADPGRVFDLEVPLDDIGEGYRAMDDRRAMKAAVRP